MSVAGLESDLPPAERVGAIIVSAGASTRMQGTDKTLADVGGEPLISRTLDVFEECSAVGCMVLIVAEENLNAIGELNRRKRWQKLADVCVGGERRQDSVRIGLGALPDCDWVVVHDGARPFATGRIIEEGLRAAAATGAAIAVVPAIDTVKRVTEDGRVAGTLDRRELVMAQTPQVFRRTLLERAHADTDEDVTDDAAMVERIGGEVRVFMGAHRNSKVTTPDDLSLARAIFAESGR